jgi:hypothetical protein
MIKALLEQVRHDELRILGCLTLIDFLNNQVGLANVVQLVLSLLWNHGSIAYLLFPVPNAFVTVLPLVSGVVIEISKTLNWIRRRRYDFMKKLLSPKVFFFGKPRT